jgi:hypothetical protein
MTQRKKITDNPSVIFLLCQHYVSMATGLDNHGDGVTPR